PWPEPDVRRVLPRQPRRPPGQLRLDRGRHRQRRRRAATDRRPGHHRLDEEGRRGRSMTTVPAETLRAWDHAHLWHPFTPLADWAAAEPLIIERGEGVYLFDVAGRRYLDGVSSLWCNVHGHRHPAIDAAVRAQLERVAHATLLGVSHPPAIALARRL